MKKESSIGKLQSKATKIEYYHRQSSVDTISESLQEREADRTRVWQFKKDHVYAVSDDQGSLLVDYRYTAFGEPEIYSPQTQSKLAGSAIANPVLWNSRRYDEQTDFYYYGYRHYKADIGRRLGRDSIEEDAGVNLYEFVGNEPIRRSDRLGLEADPLPLKDKKIEKFNCAGLAFGTFEWHELPAVKEKLKPCGECSKCYSKNSSKPIIEKPLDPSIYDTSKIGPAVAPSTKDFPLANVKIGDIVGIQYKNSKQTCYCCPSNE